MIKVIQIWENDKFFYAKVEKTRRFLLFKTKKQYVVFTENYPAIKQRGSFFKYLDTGEFTKNFDHEKAIHAYTARKAITNGASSTPV